jgi:hypothetical protein
MKKKAYKEKKLEKVKKKEKKKVVEATPSTMHHR